MWRITDYLQSNLTGRGSGLRGGRSRIIPVHILTGSRSDFDARHILKELHHCGVIFPAAALGS